MEVESSFLASRVLQCVKNSLVLVLGFKGHDEVLWADQAMTLLVCQSHEDVVQP